MLFTIKFYTLFIIFSFLLVSPFTIYAHCDSMEGPVVKAAKQALETGNINYALIWVKAENEKEIQSLFKKVIHVRALNEEAKELADNYFYEAIVRLHRQGEGVAYTGLKPVGYKPEKGLEEADIAIEKSNIEPILNDLNKDSQAKVKELFNDLQSKKNFQVDNVAAGREYVDSYVHFIHFIEEQYAAKENKESEHHSH